MLTTTKILCPIFAVVSGLMLFAVEDATLVQIVNLVLAFLTLTISTLLTHKMMVINRTQLEAKSQVDHVREKVETIERHTNSLTEKAVVAAEEKGALVGTLAEKERAEAKAVADKLTEVKIEAEVQRRLQEMSPVADQTIEAPANKQIQTIGTDVKEVKGNVKDVKTKVLSDVREGVKEGVKAATEKTQ